MSKKKQLFYGYFGRPYCHTCERYYHSLGIARHRVGHKERGEDCTITMKDGTFKYNYSKN